MGPCGCVLASQLQKHFENLILIDAGNENSVLFDAMHSLAQINTNGEIDTSFGRAFQLGGSTNLWAGRIAELDPIDFEKRSWYSSNTWPLNYEEYSSYLPEASNILGEPSESIQDASTIFGTHQFDTLIDVKQFKWADQPFQSYRWLINQGFRPRNLLVDTFVLEMERKADGIHLSTFNSKTSEKNVIKVDIIILACGGLEVTRLLLNSKANNPSGYGNSSGLLGKYFSTHPKANLARVKLKKPINSLSPYLSDTQIGQSGSYRLGFSLSAEVQNREKLLNHFFQLAPLAEVNLIRLFDSIKGKVNPSLVYSKIDNSRSTLLASLGRNVYNKIGKASGISQNITNVVIRGYLDQFPSPENKVYLSDEKDSFGYPKISVDWQFSERDRADVIKQLTIISSYLESNGIGSVDLDPLLQENNWPLVGIHSHFIGTTRMSLDKNKGVTDKYGRLHDDKNVYISGPSNFASYGFANPMKSILAFSLMQSKHILEQYG